MSKVNKVLLVTAAVALALFLYFRNKSTTSDGTLPGGGFTGGGGTGGGGGASGTW